MGSQINIENMREMSPNTEKFQQFEREVIGGLHREVNERKAKLEAQRVSREKKAKRKRLRTQASGLS